MAHVYQDRYSNLVDAKLRSKVVLAPLFNQKYEGNPKAKAVQIPVRADMTTADYAKTTGTALTYGSTAYETLNLNKDKAVNELIDGFEAAAVPDNLVADRLDSAGYALAKTIDDELVSNILTSGNSTDLTSTTALTKSTVYDAIVDAVQSAKALGVDSDEMWLAVTNATYGLLLKAPEFIRATQLGDQVVGNGFVGKIAGVNVYETNNIPTTTKVEFILGNSVFCHYVPEWEVPVHVADLADGVHIGASAVQGRKIFGIKITKSTTVLVKKHS